MSLYLLTDHNHRLFWTTTWLQKFWANGSETVVLGVGERSEGQASLPLFKIITSLLPGRKKNPTTNTHTMILLHTHTHTLFSPGAWRSYGEDEARWATEMASVQHFGSEPQWPAAKEREWYRGKDRRREGEEKERKRESRLSVLIHIKVMGQCVTWQCKQIPP